ncbi:unnamed protein product, partial [Arabidopsis halleri]
APLLRLRKLSSDVGRLVMNQSTMMRTLLQTQISRRFAKATIFHCTVIPTRSLFRMSFSA